MIEVRFQAEKQNGQIVGGTISAPTLSEAREKVKILCVQNNLKLISIEKKKTFIYKVRRGKETPITGEQKAYTKAEVEEIFNKLGYEIISIQPKLLEFEAKPSHSDILMFVKITGEMLEQNLSYGEILNFMINDTSNKVLKETLKDINNELKRGADGEQVFMKYQKIFGRFTAFMLGLASKSGNMAQIYKATAKFLERSLEFKKNLRSALITPSVTVLLLIVTTIWYVGYIFPATAKMFQRFGAELPPLTATTLIFSDFIQAYFWLLFILFMIPLISAIYYFRTEKGKVEFDRLLLKIPILGDIIHKTLIEIFSRVFYTIYSGAAENITPIRIAAEAVDNLYFEKQIKEVSLPLMVKKGIGISEALAASGVFTETALSRYRAGEETGNVKEAAIQLANYYETETVHKMKVFLDWVQIIIAMFILIVMIYLTLVSAETAVIQPKRPGVDYILQYLINLLY
jgi:type IV pilus assembly protein PilC